MNPNMRHLLLFLGCSLLMGSIKAQYLADNLATDPVADLYKAGEKAYRSGDNPTAIVLFSKVIEADPEHINAYLQRGFCNTLLKNYEKAILDFTAVIDRKPEHTWAYTSRGSAYAKLEQHTQAIADFDKVIALDAKNAEAFNNRGWSRKATGDPEGACSDWKTSKRMGNGEARIILSNNRCK